MSNPKPSKASSTRKTQKARQPRSTNRKIVRVLKKDFDAAVRQGWSASTCILAQTAMRCGIEHNSHIARASDKAWALRSRFDNYFAKPGDEKKPILQRLRCSVPLKVILSLEAMTIG